MPAITSRSTCRPRRRSSTKQLFDYTATDFRVAISNLKAAKPDAVFSADAAESSGQPALMKQLSQANLGIPYFAGVGTVSQTVIDLAGAGGNGTYSADLYFPEAEPWTSNSENQAFMKAFQKKAGQLPDKFAALGAESVDVWAQAVEAAGTTDREKVADAIKGQTFSEHGAGRGHVHRPGPDDQPDVRLPGRRPEGQGPRQGRRPGRRSGRSNATGLRRPAITRPEVGHGSRCL